MRPTPPSRATTRSDGTHGGLRFGILGPVEVTFGQTPLRIPSGRQRAVLCALLLTPNEVVSVASLVAAVWAGRPPATAKGQIQVCVAALRRTFGRFGADQLIVTRPAGYLLRVAGDRIDSSVFATRVAAAAAAEREGRLDDAVRLLREGLALWRGPVPVGAAAVAESRLTAWETCMDLELRLGRTPVDELTALVHEHPLRERLRAQLMTALFRAGRPAEALEVYWAGWRIMLDELDVEPGEELRRLEAEILAHTQLPPDPAPRTGPRQLPAGIPDFTGREALVEAAETALSTGRPVLFCGKAGIGKTALALHVAHRLAGQFPDGQLYRDLAGTDPADVLGGFLHALGAAVPDTLEERSAAYQELLTRRRLLVVLDDATSTRQVLPLLPDNGTVILTACIPLPDLPGARLLDVPPLPPDRAMDLLAKVIGTRRVTAEPTAATTLVKLAQSPLTLRAVAARLAARPHWSLASMVTRLSEERQALAPSSRESRVQT